MGVTVEAPGVRVEGVRTTVVRVVAKAEVRV